MRARQGSVEAWDRLRTGGLVAASRGAPGAFGDVPRRFRRRSLGPESPCPPGRRARPGLVCPALDIGRGKPNVVRPDEAVVLPRPGPVPGGAGASAGGRCVCSALDARKGEAVARAPAGAGLLRRLRGPLGVVAARVPAGAGLLRRPPGLLGVVAARAPAGARQSRRLPGSSGVVVARAPAGARQSHRPPRPFGLGTAGALAGARQPRLLPGLTTLASPLRASRARRRHRPPALAPPGTETGRGRPAPAMGSAMGTGSATGSAADTAAATATDTATGSGSGLPAVTSGPTPDNGGHGGSSNRGRDVHDPESRWSSGGP